MYKAVIRPILFLFPPETIHNIILKKLRIILWIPFIRRITGRLYRIDDQRLKRDFLGLTFQNPVGLAAGFDKNAGAYRDLNAFGFSFIEIGTVTPEPQKGNAKPRSFRIRRDMGLINRMGFNNIGSDAAAVRLRKKRPEGLIIGGNIGKNSLTSNEDAVADYETSFRKLYDVVDYFVVNVSCPNITDLHKLQDQESLEKILGRLLEVRGEMKIRKPLLLKISPDLNNRQLDETLDIITRLRIDGVVATNTTISRDGLLTDPGRIKAIGEGGMSGAPITSRSLEVVRYLSRKTGGKLPVIGVGGIMGVEDALNMIDAGATLIQLYTGFIYEGPGLVKRIQKALLLRTS